jgi:competence protein ComEC
LTHPQTDHYTGLIDVFKRYEVEYFITTGLDSGAQGFQALKDVVGSNGVRVINPTAGMKIRSDLIYLDILWPSKEYTLANMMEKVAVGEGSQGNVLGMKTTKIDPNNFSVVVNLSYGNFDALLTGDIGPEVTEDILKTNKIRDVEYIKIPHHGSKNGLTKELLEMATPEVGVISSGRGNSYGHPHKEIIKMLNEENITVLRTDEVGNVIVESDGEKWWIGY